MIGKSRCADYSCPVRIGVDKRSRPDLLATVGVGAEWQLLPIFRAVTTDSFGPIGTFPIPMSVREVSVRQRRKFGIANGIGNKVLNSRPEGLCYLLACLVCDPVSREFLARFDSKSRRNVR